jgi:hypothetical protein
MNAKRALIGVAIGLLIGLIIAKRKNARRDGSDSLDRARLDDEREVGIIKL